MEELRYTGTRKTHFLTGNVGDVEPGAEFSVPPELAERFLRRADVEYADGRPWPAPAGPAPDGDGEAGAQAAGGQDAGDPTGLVPGGDPVTPQRAE